MASKLPIPSVTIQLRPETIMSIQNGDDSKEEFLLEDIDNDDASILSLLQNYESEKDAMGKIYNHDSIDGLSIDTNGEGGFTIYYTVSVYSGCRDINADFENEMYIEIEVDFDNGFALLTGEELMPKREADYHDPEF